ncbi:MAG TPA: hypothetical protein PKW79_01635 [Rhabdochlamydiaceae bacterium]|nr:hypothetical protein [Rhabdochlamydiaceae bacterium]
MAVISVGHPTIPSSMELSLPIELEPVELSKDVFLQRFKNCESVCTDEFEYSDADPGEILSFNSRAIGDCITMFGMGDSGNLFAWHSSCVEAGNDKVVLEELDRHFTDHTIDEKLPYTIYLVGGNGSLSSDDLRVGMMKAISKFFKKGTFGGEFINPTKDKGFDFITANFNTRGELHYYFHNEQPHDESGYTSSDSD